MSKDLKSLIWIALRSILVFLYALFLLWLIPNFFINYSGDWMKKVADKIPLREMTVEKQSIPDKNGGLNEKNH